MNIVSKLHIYDILMNKLLCLLVVHIWSDPQKLSTSKLLRISSILLATWIICHLLAIFQHQIEYSVVFLQVLHCLWLWIQFVISFSYSLWLGPWCCVRLVLWCSNIWPWPRRSTPWGNLSSCWGSLEWVWFKRYHKLRFIRLLIWLSLLFLDSKLRCSRLSNGWSPILTSPKYFVLHLFFLLLQFVCLLNSFHVLLHSSSLSWCRCSICSRHVTSRISSSPSLGFVDLWFESEFLVLLFKKFFLL